MTRSKVKVTSPLKLEIRPFSKVISAIYNGSWQLTFVLVFTVLELWFIQHLDELRLVFFLYSLIFNRPSILQQTIVDRMFRVVRYVSHTVQILVEK